MKFQDRSCRFVTFIKKNIIPVILIFFINNTFIAQERLKVLEAVDGIPLSKEYKVSISTSSDKDFIPVHVHYIEARPKDGEWGSNFYVVDYKFSYLNFEFADTEVYVKVALFDKDIPDLEIRPSKKNVNVSYASENGYRIAILKFPKPSTDYLKASYISVVPIENGVANTKNALGIFANPLLEIPKKKVVFIKSGESIPSASKLKKGQTLVFGKGIHSIGIGYKIKSGVHYFLENGAYVKGTFEERTYKHPILEDVKIYGYGILSTNHLKRYKPDGKTKFQNSPIDLLNASNVTIEGITIEDPSHHALNIGGRSSKQGTYISKVKIIGWRANGDGIHIVGKGNVEDCFLRTQDDALYIASGIDGVTFKRIVTWNDFNGSSFIFTASGGGENVHISDCDVIYVRSRFNSKVDKKWETLHVGGGVFNLRGLGNNQTVQNIVIEDIRIEDKNSEKSIFIFFQRPSKIQPNAKNYNFKNIHFKNISVASEFLYKNKLIVEGKNSPKNITFECVQSNGKTMMNFEDWNMSGNIDKSQFKFRKCSK